MSLTSSWGVCFLIDLFCFYETGDVLCFTKGFFPPELQLMCCCKCCKSEEDKYSTTVQE